MMLRYTRNPSMAKDAWLWCGLKGALRPGVYGSGQTPFELTGRQSYTQLGTQLSEASRGAEIIGSTLELDSARYFRRYPITLTYPYTFSAWILDRSFSVVGDVVTFADTAGNNWMLLEVEKTTDGQRLDWRRYLGAGVVNVTSSMQVQTNRWNHFALVMTSTTNMTAWLNGERVITATSSHMAAASITTIGIGRFQYGTTLSGDHVDGRLGEFLEYDRALNSAEVGALAMGKSPFNIRREYAVSKTLAAPAFPWLYGRQTSYVSPHQAVA